MIASTDWDVLLSRVAAAGRAAAPDASAVLEALLSLDGTIPVPRGLGSLPAESRALVRLFGSVPCRAVALMDGCGARTVEAGHATVRVGLTPTGRVQLVGPDQDAEPVALVRGTGVAARRQLGRAVTRWQAERRQAESERLRLRAWLAARTRTELDRRLDLIDRALARTAPVRVYVGDRCFTSPGDGNVPWRSVGAADEADLLRALRARPVEEWSSEEAALVAGLWVLLASGPPSRLEEADGLHLDPGTLARFLAERAEGYGLDPGPCHRDIGSLLRLAAAVAVRREQLPAPARLSHREAPRVRPWGEERPRSTVPVPRPGPGALAGPAGIGRAAGRRDVTGYRPAETTVASATVAASAPAGGS
ncbi:hypothetical protein [Streptacidiphilus rugosus]|uniref:hypothetical protein n=1 Tax=Streptacidiphilus rugosus TaxID=405783 RepID=UPI00056CE048|nr:hypothetical protein [Streptacidiphilus rugosus]